MDVVVRIQFSCIYIYIFFFTKIDSELKATFCVCVCVWTYPYHEIIFEIHYNHIDSSRVKDTHMKTSQDCLHLSNLTLNSLYFFFVFFYCGDPEENKSL